LAVFENNAISSLNMEWQVCLVLSNACPAVLVSLWPEKEQRSASHVQKATFQSSMDLFFA
jgi:hypothetical protein